MAIQKVEGQLSQKYPDEAAKLVTYVQLVLGPVVAEARRRLNQLVTLFNDGEIEFGAIVISVVTASPTDADPDGSIAIWPGGGAGNTLWVREAGAWVAK